MIAPDDIDTMPAGREMDALVAARILDKEFELVYPQSPELRDDVRIRPHGAQTPWIHCESLPDYSTDVTAAWQIAEAIHLFDDRYLTETQNGWGIYQFTPQGIARELILDTETIPLAICRVAFKLSTGN